MLIDPNDKIKKINKVLPRLKKSLESCDLCFRKCGADRAKGKLGYCRAPANPVVYSYSPHHGEEPPLSGTNGSGTIFFTFCNMRCIYCQNYPFSQGGEGEEVRALDLSKMMLKLQDLGCHNINFVSPTHFVPQIVEALKYAYEEGLKIPTVYNTGGYDSFHIIKSLEGIVDIYLPDMRYSSDKMAEKYSDAPGYVKNNRLLVKEMFRQAGNLKLCNGIAEKGLIIRLLILPEDISGTVRTLEFIAGSISKETYLSVMSQYYPAYKARGYKKLSRRINSEEYDRVVSKLDEFGLHNGWVQPFMGGFDEKFAGENFLPNI